MVNSKYGLGDHLREKVTGLEGIVMVVAKYATGCVHVGIQPHGLDSNGKRREWDWIDQSQMELVEKRKVVFDVDENTPGGPCPSGPQL